MTRIIEEKKNELILIDNSNQVFSVPNTFYFFLKYSKFAGNKISVVLSTSPEIKVYEQNPREFICNYNKMQINVNAPKKIEELSKVLTEWEQTQNTQKFINFFGKVFSENNQEKILDDFWKSFSSRITKNPYPQYIIDGVFGISKYGTVYVKNPENKKNFPWDEINMELRGNIEQYKIIESSDGTDYIMDAELQAIAAKAFYLMNNEKKNVPAFMVQLPKKVRRWVKKGDYTKPIDFDKIVIKEPEIIVPKSYEYFPTPANIVQLMLDYAALETDMKILEPSAGQGSILDFLSGYDVTCCELYSENQMILEKKGFNIAAANLLDFKEFERYDRIIMNPPFKNQKDIDHVNHAYLMLKEGGKLISIMSNSITFRNNKKSKEFRELVEKNGYFVELPTDSFKESGTSVRTVLVVLNKEVI